MFGRSFLQFPTKYLIGYRFIVFLTLTAICNGTCKSSLFKLYNHQYLSNHVIKAVPVTSHLECSLLCLRHDECESWNFYERVLGLDCELNNGSVEEVLENSLLKRDGATFGRRIELTTKTKEATKEESKEISYVFTTLGAAGADGPIDTNGYLGTTLENHVTLRNGIQEWRVPHTGTYVIESRGAAGANGTCAKHNVNSTWQRGGMGAKLRGRFLLIEGTLLKILVGQRGIMGTAFGDRSGGGGGGSFVTYANNTPLIIAGGGGGGGGCNVIVGESDGDAGQLGVFGSRCNSTAAGKGGTLCSDMAGPISFSAGSGAGLLADGSNGLRAGVLIVAMSFVNGGKGGTTHINSNGGFGGGGYGFSYGGGGGGYTGGGVWGNSTNGIAGGGGSVNYGFDKEAGHGNTLDDGMIKIVFIA